MASATDKKATIYRMVMEEHTCPFGLKAKDLLSRQGYEIEDHQFHTRKEVDDFKAEHGVSTTPQTFIDGKRVGGYDDLRALFGKPVRDPKAVTYRPVAAVFAITVNGACHQLCRVWFSNYRACGRVVHRIFDVRAGDAQASERR